ncbi:hypothetical protein Arub01_25560 [Actinomadura rubrobrunea]|uniref:Uncharacterized protein n=1 Tax=Actinomadura rubrobrunea TaxID=115335 RepID=A0A9W6PVC5_9ACTN|nr:hypothetical protein Arub01_25560 [Actinomadura rubrobrunea]
MGCPIAILLACAVLLAVPLAIAVENVADLLGSFVFLAPFIFGIAGLVFASFRGRKTWRRQMELWNEAIPVWSELRYCHRDGIVFRNPDVYFPPAATKQFVYDEARRRRAHPRAMDGGRSVASGF